MRQTIARLAVIGGITLGATLSWGSVANADWQCHRPGYCGPHSTYEDCERTRAWVNTPDVGGDAPNPCFYSGDPLGPPRGWYFYWF